MLPWWYSNNWCLGNTDLATWSPGRMNIASVVEEVSTRAAAQVGRSRVLLGAGGYPHSITFTSCVILGKLLNFSVTLLFGGFWHEICIIFSHQFSDSPSPAGYPTIQFHSDSGFSAHKWRGSDPWWCWSYLLSHPYFCPAKHRFGVPTTLPAKVGRFAVLTHRTQGSILPEFTGLL